MRASLALAPRLALSRIQGTRSGFTLDALAVAAFSIAAWLALTVAGGTAMFVGRLNHPDPGYVARAGSAPAASSSLTFYVSLASIACALLVVPVMNLGSGAARLGARARAHRLASLRLIGMTGSDVVLISVVETLVYALIGSVIGATLYLASLPAWALVTFQGKPIAPTEMLLGADLGLAVVGVLVAVACLSTVIGLRQVRISPLGVVRESSPAAVRLWRLMIFGIAVVAFMGVFGLGTRLTPSNLAPFLALFAGFILLIVWVTNLIGPWVLQLLARLTVRFGSTARLLAMRRVIDDPKSAWRNVSAVALLGLIAAFVAIFPDDPEAMGGPDSTNYLMLVDLRTGVVITLAVAMLLAATSTLINQASIVVDRADESVALSRIGVPTSMFGAIRRRHVVMPLLATLTVSIVIGLLLALPVMRGPFGLGISSLVIIGTTIALGLVLTVLAAEACRPLQTALLRQQRRRDD